MDLIIYIVFMAIIFILLISGYAFDSVVLKMVAWCFLFIINVPVINEGIDYQVSTNTYMVYGNNYTGYHWDYTSPSPSVNDVNLFHTVEEPVFKNFGAHWIAFFLSALSVFGFGYSIYEERVEKNVKWAKGEDD